MKILFLFLILSGCASISEISTLSPSSDISKIPSKSNKIIVETKNMDSDNFIFCMKKLLEYEYEITSKDKEIGYILAEKKSKYDTYVKINVSFVSGNINIIPSWKAGSESLMIASAVSGINNIQSGWEPAIWSKSGSKPSVAFLEADKLAHSFNSIITYDHPEPKVYSKDSDPIYN